MSHKAMLSWKIEPRNGTQQIRREEIKLNFDKVPDDVRGCYDKGIQLNLSFFSYVEPLI